MAFYTRRQLVLLLALLAAAAGGLAVREWRAAYPELAERLEQFDREPNGRDGGTAPGLERQLARETSPPPGRAASTRVHVPAGERGRSAADHHDGRLDVNRAAAEDLARLPGVGPVLATRIVAAREANGHFGSIDELKRVKGLGPVRVERLRALVTATE